MEFLEFQCLQYCYLYPQFYKNDIIQIWEAGEVTSNGLHIFEELMQSDRLQFSHLDPLTGEPRYKLNSSLVHEIEQDANSEFRRVNEANSSISINTHHVSLEGGIDSTIFKRLCEVQRLKTLLVLHQQGSLISQIPQDIFIRFPLLEILDLGDTAIKELPRTIGILQFLRYLNLSGTLLVALPNSLCNCSSLQTLKLRGCSKLAALPKGLRKLRNLRYLDVDVISLSISMPPGIGDLIKLKLLPAFMVGMEEGYYIRELKHLGNLHGTLRIARLDKILTPGDAKEAAIDEKMYLHRLELQWYKQVEEGFVVLENLKPHSNLKELQIVGYGGSEFPNWVGNPIFSSITTITIHDCKNCGVLPILGVLSALRYLSLTDMNAITMIDGKFCGRDHSLKNQFLPGFPFLERLMLNGMPMLETWIEMKAGDFPRLQELYISCCPRLKALPEFSLFNRLQHLEITDCPTVEFLGNSGLPKSLKELVIIDCPFLKVISNQGQNREAFSSIPNVWIDCEQLSDAPSSPTTPITPSAFPILTTVCTPSSSMDKGKDVMDVDVGYESMPHGDPTEDLALSSPTTPITPSAFQILTTVCTPSSSMDKGTDVMDVDVGYESMPHGDPTEDLDDHEGSDVKMVSQSNVDHHNGINLSIRNQEDEERIETSMQDDMVYEKIHFTSQKEQTSSPSDVPPDLSSNGFAAGTEFPDIDALSNYLSDMAVRTEREYKHARTSPSQLSMKCSSEGCKWHVLARLLPNSRSFKVVKYQEVHTCMVRTNSGDKDHPQATVRWILSKVQSNIEKDPNMEPMKIVKQIKERYGILISYNKAVKAKTMALDLMRNQKKDSYPQPHPDICRALIKELERGGTICRLGLSSDGSSFQHLFWAFPACIDALRNHLRPVIYVRSVKIEIGVLMYAHGIDGDGFYGDPIEVGFALCVREDDEAWERFLSWLKEFVLPPQPPPTFTIVTDFQETVLTHAVQIVLPHLHHFFSPQSFSRLFSEKFNDPNLYLLCMAACLTFSTEKCEEALQDIKRLNKEAYEWLESVGSKSHWAIAFSPNKHVGAALGKMVRENDYLVLTVEDNTSVVEIVERSRDMVANYFSKRGIKGANVITTQDGLTPGVMKDIARAKDKVESINGHKYQVKEYNATRVVDLKERSCTCGQFQATEYPCDHAMIAIVHEKLEVKDYLSHHRWYSVDTYLATYAGNLPPPISKDIISQWRTAVNEIPDLPPKRTESGRPRKVPKFSI